jgi:PAS domain S-box-containing protein
MRIGTRIGVGFVAALAVVAGVSAVSWFAASDLTRTTQWVDHTNDVLRSVDQTLADLVDVETGARGYAITGSGPFLTPFELGMQRVPADIAQLERLVADDPIQRVRVMQLHATAHRRLDLATALVATRRSEGAAEAVALVERGGGKVAMDQARAVIATIHSEELRLLARRTAQQRERAIAVRRVTIASATALSLLALAGVVLLTQSITRPLRSLGRTARRIGGGERTVSDEATRRDEIGDLARAFDAMALQRARADDRLRTLLDDAGDAFLLADLDGRYIDVNVAACTLAGYRRDELLGKTIMDLIPREDVPRLAASKERLLSPGAVETDEWTLVRKDGEHVPVEVTAKILADGRWQAFLRDIRERKRANAERERLLVIEQQHRRQLETIRESALTISALWTATGTRDIAGVLQAIVDEARRLTGADYAALGVGMDRTKPFEPWVYSGMTAEDVMKIGRAPRPLGVLGYVAEDGTPLRIDHYRDHPRSVGTPPGHPPVDGISACRSAATAATSETSISASAPALRRSPPRIKRQSNCW